MRKVQMEVQTYCTRQCKAQELSSVAFSLMYYFFREDRGFSKHYTCSYHNFQHRGHNIFEVIKHFLNKGKMDFTKLIFTNITLLLLIFGPEFLVLYT